MRKSYWVSRDLGDYPDPGCSEPICIWATKPVQTDGSFFSSRCVPAIVCAEGFKRATGLRIAHGECKRVRFSVEVLGDQSRQRGARLRIS